LTAQVTSHVSRTTRHSSSSRVASSGGLEMLQNNNNNAGILNFSITNSFFHSNTEHVIGTSPWTVPMEPKLVFWGAEDHNYDMIVETMIIHSKQRGEDHTNTYIIVENLIPLSQIILPFALALCEVSTGEWRDPLPNRGPSLFFIWDMHAHLHLARVMTMLAAN
jgi:hypothetical protein